MKFLNEVRFEKCIHSLGLYQAVKAAWQDNNPLILCPPHLKDIPSLENFSIPPEMIFGLFTSGTSTGKPRLILYSKKNIESSLKSIRKLFDVKKIDHIFCYPQPTHVFGLVLGYLQSIIYNIPITFSEGAYSSEAHKSWNKSLTKGTLTLGTPVHFFDLMKYNSEQKINPPASYTSIVGGALCTVKLWNDKKSILKIESPSIGYGASEASPGICHLPPGVEPQFNGDVGQVLDGVDVFDVNAEGFHFKGDNLCLGMIDNGQFVQPKSVYIKDAVEKNQQFCVYGRADLVINRGGLKYNPEVMEMALSEVGVRALFLPLYNERLGQDIAILIEDQFSEKTKSFVRNFIFERFGFKINEPFIVFDKIPLNANLKINRREALKRVIKNTPLSFPVSTKVLEPFLPHRGSAVWVDEIVEFKPRFGRGRVYVDEKKFYVSDQAVRPSALIEFVAQAYGYSFVLDEIFNSAEINPANNTFIAEIRDVRFSNQEILKNVFNKHLDINVECTHDFVKIKVIKGSVYFEDKKLIELSLKVAVF